MEIIVPSSRTYACADSDKRLFMSLSKTWKIRVRICFRVNIVVRYLKSRP